MGSLTTFGLGVAASLVAAMALDLLAPLSRHLAQRAARRLPEAFRDEVLEQWLADIDATSSQLRKIRIAFGLFEAGARFEAPKLPVVADVAHAVTPSGAETFDAAVFLYTRLAASVSQTLERHKQVVARLELLQRTALALEWDVQVGVQNKRRIDDCLQVMAELREDVERP